MDHECEVCKSGPPKCDKCNIELVKVEYEKTEEDMEITILECPKCKNKKMDFKIPTGNFDKGNFGA